MILLGKLRTSGLWTAFSVCRQSSYGTIISACRLQVLSLVLLSALYPWTMQIHRLVFLVWLDPRQLW